MHLLTNDWASLAWMQLWQVTSLAAAVLVLAGLSARRRPHVAYLLWMLVIAKCVTPPLWASPVGVFSLVQSSIAAGRVVSESANSPNSEPPAQEVEPASLAAESSPSTTASPIPAADPHDVTLDVRSIAIRVLSLIWLAGVLAIATAIIWKWTVLRRHLLQMGSPADPEIERRVRSLAEQLEVRSIPRVLALKEPAVPAVFGVFRPTILLPEALLAPDRAADLDATLAHELVHIRRRDPLASRLQLIAQALWWFHPLIWRANREARHERERCCDEAVIAGLNYPRFATRRRS